MQAKKVYEAIGDVFQPKKVNKEDYLRWKFQNDLRIELTGNKWKDYTYFKKGGKLTALNTIIHHTRHKDVVKWVEENTPFTVKNIKIDTNLPGTIIYLNEGVSDILKPKSTEEISKELFFVRDLDDLYIGHEYLILDRGMNQWMNALTYDGVKDAAFGKHAFVSSFIGDDFSIEFTEEELLDSIADKEIALDNTGMTDFI